MAVLNDSTGTLMSCAHKNLDCRIGVIIGKENRQIFSLDVARNDSFYPQMREQIFTRRRISQ